MHIVIFITAASKREAEKIAKALLKKKLVACVNITQRIKSFFWWQGKIDSAREYLLIAKSERSMMRKITGCVKSLHSYEVPEILALPIIAGYNPYLDWISDSIG
jgi:periplasmic divalent cation tolerance protein